MHRKGSITQNHSGRINKKAIVPAKDSKVYSHQIFVLAASVLISKRVACVVHKSSQYPDINRAIMYAYISYLYARYIRMIIAAVIPIAHKKNVLICFFCAAVLCAFLTPLAMTSSYLFGGSI